MCKQVALRGIVGEEFNDTQVALRVGELGNAKEDASRASTLKIRLFCFLYIKRFKYSIYVIIIVKNQKFINRYWRILIKMTIEN